MVLPAAALAASTGFGPSERNRLQKAVSKKIKEEVDAVGEMFFAGGVSDAAMDVLEADHLTTDLGPLVDKWTDLAGELGDEVAGRMLHLPPPSSYQPLSPWAVTWDS